MLVSFPSYILLLNPFHSNPSLKVCFGGNPNEDDVQMKVRGIIRKKDRLIILKTANIYIPLDCELLETMDCILISYPQCLAHTRHSLVL